MPRFRGSIDKQDGKLTIILLKYTPEDLYHIYWLLWCQLSCKKCLLVLWQILRLFPNILASNDKYHVLNRDNLTISIQIQLYQKQKKISGFFSAFLKSTLNFEHFEKKMTLIDFVFPKLWAPKTLLDKCLKSPCSENPSSSNTVNGA